MFCAENKAKDFCISQTFFEGITFVHDTIDISVRFCIVFLNVTLRAQTKLLKKAVTMWENEKQLKKDERERILNEKVPALQMSALSLQELQVHQLMM